MKEKECDCGDYTNNQNGICDTCQMLDDMKQQDQKPKTIDDLIEGFNEHGGLINPDKLKQFLSETIESFNEKDIDAYKIVLEHRGRCSKWGKEFCLECFGGGLTQYKSDILKQLKNKLLGEK